VNARYNPQTIFRPLKIAGLLFGLCLSFNVAAQQTWTPNFKDSDIQEVIKFMGEATGKTIIIDPKVRGPVKLINTRPLNSQELYALFLSVLDVHGYTAIESGNVVRIVPNRDARSLPVPNQSAVSEVDDTYITQVIQLKNISATKVLPTLRPLVPQYGHISAYDASNALIITDTRANIIRLNEIIARIDQSAVIGTDVIELRYAQATDVVNIINQIEKPDPNRGTTSSPVLIVADRRINAVVVNGDDLQRQRVRVLVDNMDRPQTKNSNFRVVYLKYAKAENVAKVLNGMVQSLVQRAPGGEGQAAPNQLTANIQSDETTNSVLLTADGDTMESLLSVVDSLDIRRAQVLVEAIIVEISGDVNRELGVQWMYSNADSGFGSSTLGDGRLAAIAAPALDLTGNGLAGLATGLASVPGQVFGIGRIGGGTDFLAILKMLQSNSSTNILSTPNLLTTDNNKALIKVGQEVPIQTGSYTSVGTGGSTPTNPFSTFDRKDVGINLEVTPHVNEGDTVVLDIRQEVSSLANTTSIQGVVTNKREIETQILVADGQTVVLGGLIKDDVETSDVRVPLLSSIPILGHAFRSQSSKAVKTNLLVFIRATIVRDDRILTGATAEKYRTIREEQMELRRNRGILVESRSVPVIPDWAELEAYRAEIEAAQRAADALQEQGVAQ
jgi:general secretion pathway protein D